MKLLLFICLFYVANATTCSQVRSIYNEANCCSSTADVPCLREIPDCGGCTDGSKTTETECLSHEDVTTGTPLASTDANYLDQTACYQYFHANYPYPVAFTVTGVNGNGNDPHGCFRKTSDTSSHGYFNVDTGGSGACTASKPCIQKSDNAWSGSIHVGAGQVCVDANNKIIVKGLSDAFDFSNANHITLKKSIIPDANNAYDLGNAEYKIRDIYEAD